MTRYVIVGGTTLGQRVHVSLAGRGCDVTLLSEPSDDDLAEAVRDLPDAVAVLVRDDVAALRYALAIAHLAPQVRLVVTIFDRTVGGELRRLLPTVVVTSAAEVGAPLLMGPCLRSDIAATRRDGDSWQALSVSTDLSASASRIAPPRRWRRWAKTMSPSPWPVVDAGERMLILGAGGIGAALVFETLSMRASQGWSWAHAFYSAVNVVGTVGPAHGGSGWTYWLPAGLMLLLTVGFAAMFVAGLVDRLVRPPLSSVMGRRSVPRSGHVIVVGLGQVGLRLCRELQSFGIPVIGVERDERATNLRFARTEKIPVIVGHGEDRGLLRALRLDRAIALAAVSSEDLDNVAVAVAAHAIADQVLVVLRAGEQEAVAETRSLLPLGITRDVTAATAASVVAAMEDSAASVVLQVGDQVGVWTLDGEFGHWLPRRSALGSGVKFVGEVRPPAEIR